jgi:hypothetical protein
MVETHETEQHLQVLNEYTIFKPVVMVVHHEYGAQKCENI